MMTVSVRYVKANPNHDGHGRFAHGSGGGGASSGNTMQPATRNAETKKWQINGKDAPEHVQSLGIPPAWKNVHVNPNPNGDVMAKGVDAKGRTQMKYSDSHNAQAAAAKFVRVSELRKKRAGIFKEVDADAKNPAHKENAECLKVIMQTGIRPGSTQDTGADHASFGATTLQGRHVITNADGSVSLKFATGKNKGREVEFPISDKSTAKMLNDRASRAGSDGSLFKTTAGELRSYSKSKDGGGFKTKDHRTALGTETAIRAMKDHPVPKTMKEYKAQIKSVATVVAKTLGNTPAIALQSYIDPTVFSGWKVN